MSEIAAYEGASPESLACVLRRHPDYRVQRRLRPMYRLGSAAERSASTLSGCALDVRTSGFDHRKHVVIELAIQRFKADGSGRIVDVGLPFHWFEDGGVAVPQGNMPPTAIDRASMAGRRICDAEATCMILDGDFVIVHNAAFARPFVERRLPLAANQPWICSMQDVDWPSRGFDGGILPGLLHQMGWFYDSERADAKVNALLHLLDHPSVLDGRTVLAEAVATASRLTKTGAVS